MIPFGTIIFPTNRLIMNAKEYRRLALRVTTRRVTYQKFGFARCRMYPPALVIVE